MSIPHRDQIFISYSRKDQEIYREVRQKLLDYSLGEHVWDDTEIRLSEQWDDRIQEGMDSAAAAQADLAEWPGFRDAAGWASGPDH